MRVALAALLTTFATISAQAEDAPLPKRGERVSVTDGLLGCADTNDTRKFLVLMADGDREAATKFALGRLDRCTPFPAGAEVTVEDISVWNRMACVRPRGEPDCRWLPLMILKTSAAK